MNRLKSFLSENKLEAFLLFGLIAFTYATMPFLGYDHPIEEAVEWVIKVWSGVDIDLSPEAMEEYLPIEDFSPNP